MSFALNLNVTRNGIAKGHGSLNFSPAGAGGGTVYASTLGHGREPGASSTWNYTIANGNIIIDISATYPLVLNGNRANHSVTYITMSGSVQGLDPTTGVFSSITGGVLTYMGTPAGRPDDGFDSWDASATLGKGHSGHGKASHGD